MASVGREAVPFQRDCAPADARALLAAAGKDLALRLAATHARVAKHLGATSPYLVGEVWDE